jgi:hypothetical protein
MRRACYEALGKFDERIWHGPDVEMDARLASRYGFYHCGGVHTSFRRHGSNMGSLEYLRDDFLAVDVHKKRLAWSSLSLEGRRRLGVDDLEAFLAREAAASALLGATVTLGYGHRDLSRRYLRLALGHDRRAWRMPRFWKVLALLAVPQVGEQVVRRRMNVTAADVGRAHAVERSLRAQQTAYDNPLGT